MNGSSRRRRDDFSCYIEEFFTSLRCNDLWIVIEYKMVNWHNEAIECVYTLRKSVWSC